MFVTELKQVRGCVGNSGTIKTSSILVQTGNGIIRLTATRETIKVSPTEFSQIFGNFLLVWMGPKEVAFNLFISLQSFNLF